MGKTITTYLIDGTPKGVQTVVISNRTMIAYNIPRTRIDILREDERKELRTPALYILIGEEESGNPKAYIGETENFDRESVTISIRRISGKELWYLSRLPMTRQRLTCSILKRDLWSLH